VTFQFRVDNPPAKPNRNALEFAHCRGASSLSVLAPFSLCPLGGSIVGSIYYRLWPIIPHVASMNVELLPPAVEAAGKSSLFLMSFSPTSSGAVKMLIECRGMDFGGCTAEHEGITATCDGYFGGAMISLALGQGILLRDVPFMINIRRVVNPAESGPTTWAVTTFGPPENGQDVMLDQTVGHMGYNVLGHLEIEPVVICRAEFILDPEISNEQKSACTSQTPWYEYKGNAVTLRFKGLMGPDPTLGRRLLVAPPQGYSFERMGGPPIVPLTGFPEITGYSIELSSSQLLGNSTWLPSSEFIVARLASSLVLGAPFSIRVLVDNPVEEPMKNLWRVMLLTADLAPLYTNDGDWVGFPLKGTFQGVGVLTAVQWLVTDFPSEINVVRLMLSLASPLRGQGLQLRIGAPLGFVFDPACLPPDPDVVPRPRLGAATPWVSQCTAELQNRHKATLDVAIELEKGIEYATNLVLKNAALHDPSAAWELYTFHNNDAANFAHFAKLPAFRIMVLEASVTAEAAKFGESSLLHVSLRSLRDLGPFGQIVVTAPDGYTLFCRLRPFFSQGSLPSGTQCDGANNYALVQLSGTDFVERGIAYHFAVRVTNPTQATFDRKYGDSVDHSLLYWKIRLQTRDRELVHESAQVAGYIPTQRAVSRFEVMPGSRRAGSEAKIRVQFKLETQLLRWRRNLLELEAPTGFLFSCAADLARDLFVEPSRTVLKAGVAQFQDLAAFLEQPPTHGVEAYRNEGTTDDGRAIVDCGSAGRLVLAVDFTDASSLGRYVFEVLVQNPWEPPAISVWFLRTFSDGQRLEEGATGGYDVTNYAMADDGRSDRSKKPGASSAVRIFTTSLVLFLLLVPYMALGQFHGAPP